MLRKSGVFWNIKVALHIPLHRIQKKAVVPYVASATKKSLVEAMTILASDDSESFNLRYTSIVDR